MLLHILGSAAGGGFPQWNCGCGTCSSARRDPSVSARTTCSLVLSSGDGHWFLVNAAAEIGMQVAGCSSLWPPPGTRDTPIDGVLLTDAELDHTLGLLAMRHASVLDVYSTPTVRALLDAAGLSAILAAYVELRWHDVCPGVAFGLHARDGSDAGLRCEAVSVGTGRVPRYAQRYVQEFDQDRLEMAVVAYRVLDTRCGVSALIMPTAPRIPAGLIRGSDDILVLDGTFWADDELGLPGRSAADLGHVPLNGSSGTLAVIMKLEQSGPRKPRLVYTHFNNTNPVLADSVQRRMLISAGAELAYDGMEIRLEQIGTAGERSDHDRYESGAHT